MHNPVGPGVEAHALYILQSGLEQRLREPHSGELVIFDVGLGAAANALAALNCARTIHPARPLRIISFERELTLLRFALDHADQLPYLRGTESILEALLATQQWSQDGITWELRHGDFNDQIEKEPFKAHLVFFDPYSVNVNKDMWTAACFKKLRLKSREPDDGGTLLMTYTKATPVRSALLYAGFYVGAGQSTGLKDETTQAATCLDLLDEPLGARWLERWKRSHTPFPFDCPADEEERVREVISTHEQFCLRV